MKPHLTIAHEGTLGDEDRTRFKFHEESIAHIMRVLTDLYENPELAVIREYSTNARDAHIAAGKADVPIHVTLPTPLDSTFIVRDEGLGLSRDEIVSNLTQYGYSSKRDTDDEVGMLGLGSKSALTYTSQFSYVACKNGKTVRVLITREDDGAPVLQVIDESPTPDTPNFVEVHVPVKNPSIFSETARKFFWFWEPGTVLLNGAPPDDTIWSDQYRDELWLSEDVVLIQAARYGGSKATVVMGNVPYRLSHEQAPSLIKNLNGYELYAFVDVGTVDFTPSRESLMMSKRTQECIHTLNDFISDRLYQALSEKFDSMEYKEANDWARERQGLCRSMWEQGKGLKCRGRLITFNHSMPIPMAAKGTNGAWSFDLNPSRWSRSDRAEKSEYLNFTRPPRIVVHGFTGASVPGDLKEAVRARARRHGINGSGYYETALLTAKPLDADVLEAIGNPPQFALDDVYTKSKAKPRTSKAVETRYRMVDADNPEGWTDVHELDYRPDCYVLAADYRETWAREQAQALVKAGHRVALVWGRNKKWFAENHGDVKHIRQYAEWWANVRVPELLRQMGDIARHRLHYCVNDDCKRLGSHAITLGDMIEQISDPRLRDHLHVVNVAKMQRSPSVDKIVASQRPVQRLGYPHNIGVSSKYCDDASKILRAFPILEMVDPSRLRMAQRDELVRIINLAYGPQGPSTELVLWDSTSNPNRIAGIQCDFSDAHVNIINHKGALL